MQTKRKALESEGEDQKKGQGFVSSVGSWDSEGDGIICISCVSHSLLVPFAVWSSPPLSIINWYHSTSELGNPIKGSVVISCQNANLLYISVAALASAVCHCNAVQATEGADTADCTVLTVTVDSGVAPSAEGRPWTFQSLALQIICGASLSSRLTMLQGVQYCDRDTCVSFPSYCRYFLFASVAAAWACSVRTIRCDPVSGNWMLCSQLDTASNIIWQCFRMTVKRCYIVFLLIETGSFRGSP
jgi:hypothetical protein